MKRYVSYLALSAVAVSVMAGCGGKSTGGAGGSDSNKAGDTVKIGFVNHLTGDIAPYGTSMKNGTELAVDYVNSNGGINGKKLEVLYKDDQSKTDQAVTLTRQLIEKDKVPIIMGSAASSFTLAMAEVAKEAKVVHLSPISTNPKLANSGKFFFALMPGDYDQGAAWMDVVKKQNVKEAAVVYINNDYGTGVKDVFVKAFEKDGGKVLTTLTFNEGATTFQTQAQKLKESGAKYTFMVSHVKEGALFIKQSAEAGVKTQFVGDTALQTDDLPKQAGSAANGVWALAVGQKDHPKYQDFVKAYKAKFNTDPTIWADFAWDTVLVAAEGLKKGGTDPDKVRTAISALKDYAGATGPINFDERGIRKATNSFAVYKVEGDKWAPAK